jgi:hypothetical protein
MEIPIIFIFRKYTVASFLCYVVLILKGNLISSPLHLYYMVSSVIVVYGCFQIVRSSSSSGCCMVAVAVVILMFEVLTCNVIRVRFSIY